MGVIVLAEHEAHQMAVLGDDGQSIQLVVPNDIVGGLQTGALGSGDDLLHRGHELGDLGGGVHAADTVVPAGHQAQQLAGAGAVVGDGHGGVAGALFQRQHVGQSVGQAQVGIAEHETGLVVFHLADHLGLLLNGLGDIDESDAALLRQSDAHLFAGHRLHDGGDHGDIHGQRAFLALFELDHRGLQGYIGGDAVLVRIAWHQQVLAEGAGGFLKIICHEATSFQRFMGILPQIWEKVIKFGNTPWLPRTGAGRSRRGHCGTGRGRYARRGPSCPECGHRGTGCPQWPRRSRWG